MSLSRHFHCVTLLLLVCGMLSGPALSAELSFSVDQRAEQVQIGAAWPDVLQVVLTTAFALIYGLFRDDDGDGVKNIHDRQPDNPTEA